MRLAVLSDVHSNLEALNAVLAAAGADRVVVLGDLIGYGADPEGVVTRLLELRATLLAGNHDLALTGRFDLRWFNRVAADAIEWTRGNVGAAHYDALAALEPIAREDGRVLVHGSVRQPESEYLLNAATAEASFDAEPFNVGLYGHTHIPFAYERSGEGVRGMMPQDEETLELDPGLRYLLNPGSVGQPRDGDARASYLIVEGARVTWHRVPYDVEAAQRKIRAAGLPAVLADRLSAGR